MKRIFLQQDGLSGSGPVPAGYTEIGYNGATFSEKYGLTSSPVCGGCAQSPYLVYRALISQLNSVSAGVPTAVVLENTLGSVPTFQKFVTGDYAMHLNITLPSYATHVLISQTGKGIGFHISTYNATSDIYIKTYLQGTGYYDNVLDNESIEVKVYPAEHNIYASSATPSTPYNYL